ncbi:MAG TPA: LPS biosynthesis choline kinase [Aliiroseovarius sp.]|nr:LPS biosynthesis choline kinase [Aliiroseovarius sp.]
MSDNKDAVRAALQNLPEFAGVAGDQDFTATRLGGLTNLVYRVDMAGRKVIVRIPGAGTDAYIDRKVELHNARTAARAGVSPRVLWADAQTGVMIADCLDPVTTMTPDLFASTDGAVARAGAALAALHGCGQDFQFRFELFAMIDEYLTILADKQAELPPGYHDIVAAAEPVRAALDANPVPLAPCHNDPLCENFLDQGDKMWIVDWEYSGMNDPMWDLGDLSVEGGFTAAQDTALLHAYFGRAPSAAEQGRVVIYKAMCDLLWTLWGLIQHADQNPAEDFWAYSIGRFERCKTLMNSPGFAAHVAAING